MKSSLVATPSEGTADGGGPDAVPMSRMNKVAVVTFLFWVMKISATTLGETGGDLLSMTLDIGYASSTLILLLFFATVLAVQLSVKRYCPPVFWAVILATSTAGTTMSDFMDRTLGLGYAAGSAILFTGLLVVLAVWKKAEGSLSVSSVRTRRTELFYWTAILFSNTLGTAFGDFLSDDSGLGFIGSACLVGGAILLAALAFLFTKANRVALFWVAFVLTRPFGAAFGDLLTKPVEKGGLDLGTIGSSAVLGTILVALVVLETVRRSSAARR
jgi:uncharacterized membrane-anchored protein